MPAGFLIAALSWMLPNSDAGQISLATGFGAVLLPALIGNILGGTGLFSLIAYAQVQEEM